MNKPVWILLFITMWVFAAPGAQAQEQRYSLAVQGISLTQALEQFVNVTGAAVSYDPSLVTGHRTYCAAENASAETVLRCILRESGLDFYRLSSGTYVLTPAIEIAPRPGYLSGTVVDRDTGRPLTYAHVFLDQAGLGSVTNQSGQFIFSPVLPGRYVLSVTHVGYEAWHDTLRVFADIRTTTEASLQAKPVVFTPIIVDGLHQRLPSESLAETVIDTQEGSPDGLAILNGGATVETRLYPGIRVNDITADINVQGGESGDHQMVLDGVPVFLPRTMMGFLGPFSAFSIDQITVHKAGFAVSHGSQTAGIISLQHAVGAGNHFDAQIDPFSLNARWQYTPQSTRTSDVSVMAAARIGLWNVYRPTRLASMLNAWSTPDPFLLGAPLAEEENRLESFSRTLALKPALEPELHFSDIHGAVNIRLLPLHTIHASFYAGDRSLGGSLLPSEKFGATTMANDEAFLAVVDDYNWTHRLGQIRYQSVLGGHSLISTQLSGSSYRLDNSYVVLDSLAYNVVPEFSTPFTRTVSDANEVRTLVFKTSIDHARGIHQLRFGVENTLTDSRFNLYSVAFQESGGQFGPDIVDNREFIARYDVEQDGVRHTLRTWRLVTFGENEIAIKKNTSLRAGVRLTYIPDRITVYAEPRLSLRYDHPNGWLGPWSSFTAFGIYRQYLNQLDVSKLSTGTLLPSVRIWLPIDYSVRPPLAYHFSQAVLVSPAPRLQFRLEGYYKYQPHGLVVRYSEQTADFLQGTVNDQSEFLTSFTGHSYGGTALLTLEGKKGQVRAMYEYNNASRKSPALFDRRRVPVPWNEPHRLIVALQWSPLSSVSFNANWSGIWGRTWAFRRAYYDYLGQTEQTRYHGPYDLGRPEDHVLAPYSQLDLNLTYTHTLGSSSVQIQFDVLNVLDNKNEADWRIVSESGGVSISPRYYFSRLTSFAVRLSY